MGVFSLNVNGAFRSVEVEGDTPLLWVLRDNLGLTGTKFGCGIALCGACTVFIDDKPSRACSLPISALGESDTAGQEMFGVLWRGEESDGGVLDRYMSWVAEFRRAYVDGRLKPPAINVAAQGPPDVAEPK